MKKDSFGPTEHHHSHSSHVCVRIKMKSMPAPYIPCPLPIKKQRVSGEVPVEEHPIHKPERPVPRVSATHSPTTVENTIYALCSVVGQVVRENETHMLSGHRCSGKPEFERFLKAFHSASLNTSVVQKSSFSTQKVFKFVKNFLYRTRFKVEGAVALLIYLDRIISDTSLVLTRGNWKLVIFMLLVLSQKMHDDYCYDNAEYVKLYPQMSVDLMNKYERLLLRVLHYNLSLPAFLYNKYFLHLQNLYKNELRLNLPLTPSTKRKTLSYSRLNIKDRAIARVRGRISNARHS
ncbi:hypothetical protein PCE1_001267 [Barthelona sp. PCE]